MKIRKTLSLVVPAYRQERTIVRDVKNLDRVLSSLSIKHEILIIADGFVDKTYELARNQESRVKNLKVFGYKKNKGKGYAIKYGIEKAKGDIIGFIDAGMDLDPKEISKMLDTMERNNADIVIGSKLHPESRVNYPFIRKIPSWGYRTLTHLLFGFSVRDTQVGLKLFRREAAKKVFERILIKRFAFDVEVLALAYSLGFKKIYETPVKIDFSRYSSISPLNFWMIILHMLWDTAAVFYRLKILHYYDKSSKQKTVNKK